MPQALFCFSQKRFFVRQIYFCRVFHIFLRFRNSCFGEKLGFGKVGFGGSRRVWRNLREKRVWMGEVSSNLDVMASSYGHVKIGPPPKSVILLDM